MESLVGEPNPITILDDPPEEEQVVYYSRDPQGNPIENRRPYTATEFSAVRHAREARDSLRLSRITDAQSQQR